MILSRAKPATHAGTAGHGKPQHGAKQAPGLEEFLAARDYTGALTVLEFGGGKGDPDTELWAGYCAFHLGDYRRAASVYEALGHSKSPAPQVALNLACCYFFLGMYPEAYRVAETAEDCSLRVRLMFHLAHKLGDEARLMQFHHLLEDVTEDQLCLAAIHYLRSHYQEAIDIYKKLLLDRRDYLALNVYVALCYYKLDYYDVSQEVLQVYLQAHPDSAVAINLKACNHFRLYNGKAAENELRTLLDHSSSSSFGRDLVRHNQVVFRGGEAALQVLPALVDVVPEARLNLVIYYLRQDDVHEAHALIKDLEPVVPQEYILKAVVNAALGQEIGSREHLKVAQQFFQVVGSSSSECDTIPGRQCMASCLFLQRQFEDVLIYLSSIKSFFSGDDAFNFNYAQAQAAKGNFREAEEAFLLVQSDKLRADYTYISHLARCSAGQRLLQDGPLLVRGEGLRRAGAPGPRAGALGGQARRLRGRVPARRGGPHAQGVAGGGDPAAPEHGQLPGGAHHPRHEALGQGQPRQRLAARRRPPHVPLWSLLEHAAVSPRTCVHSVAHRLHSLARSFVSHVLSLKINKRICTGIKLFYWYVQ